MLRASWIFFAAAVLCYPAVTRINVTERVPTGPYERITAIATFEIDPKLPANRIITDLDKAPLNAHGRVEWTADLVVIRPRDEKAANGTILFEVSNRGGMGLLNMFQSANSNTLLEQGYTLVWLGWQNDVPKGLRMHAPSAEGIHGLVRSDILVDKETDTQALGDRNHIAYEVINPEAATMTVRDSPTGPRQSIAHNKWSFTADGQHVKLNAGFEPGRLYEVIYQSENPSIVGLGPAGIRDLISFFKYGGGPSILSEHMKRAIGYGASQSGRFLRTFLYYGFNADEQDRKVFDGIMAHIAGGGRGSFNHRFAQPSRDAHPMLNFFYPTDIFPFTDLPEKDPETGLNEGLLDKARAANVVPKIFYTNGSYEYWGRSAALIHALPDGMTDAPLAPETRIYYLAGTQHGPNAQLHRNGTQNLANPMDYRWMMHALLADMNAWVKDGTEPPPSQYPQAGKDQLVPLAALHFPAIPGVAVPKSLVAAMHVDYGPDFKSKGIVAYEPPKLGKPFPILLPQTNSDGNEIAGVHSPELAVPLGTYTGWNLRSVDVGAPQYLANMIGSFLPFAKTKADREKSGDPRPSIEERYKDKDDYLAKITTAAQALADHRLILAADIPLIRDQAAQRWDWVMQQ
ncbi:MAG TPA: alpha/beta hydrolase domain-containing protein [Bryobacteraceae bacterium]|jgi:hypothetical protein